MSKLPPATRSDHDAGGRPPPDPDVREIERRRLIEAQAVAQVGSWVTDLVTLAVTWSAETHRIFETDPASFRPTHQGFLDVVHPEDRSAVDAAFVASLNQRDPQVIEHRLLLPGGRIKIVEERWQVFADAQGRPLHAIGTCRDVTERKRAEMALAESERRQRELADRLIQTMESITDALYGLDANWCFTLVNPEAERLLKQSRADLIGRNLWQTFPEAVGTVFETEFRRAMAEGKTAAFESYYPPFKSWFVVRAYPSKQGLTVYFRDITQAREAEQKLRESEERFRLVTKATNDAVWDWDLATDALWWSDGFERLFGHVRGEIPSDSHSWTDFLHPDDAPRISASIDAALAGQAAEWSAEYRFRCKDGRYLTVLDRGRIIRDENGRARRMIGGMTNLTERKRQEELSLRAQRMESIGTLAGGIAHDLNNLLAPIVMGVGLLKRQPLPEAAREVLANIEQSARRSSELVKQVLSFARGIEGERIPLQLEHIIREVAGIIANTFPRNIVFETHLAPDLMLVTGDATQLNQVLLNLCVNARDAMPGGGRLTITAGNRTVDAQYAATDRTLTAGDYVVIEVSDTGGGMSREVQSRIFEPFFTTKEIGKGTGLGLSTVLGIVRSHQGVITVQSEPGSGSTFRVWLPAQPQAEAEPAAVSAPPVQAGRGEMIMVVDDEMPVLVITQQTLEVFGYRVVTASDGAQAVSLYAQHAQEIALVLTDLMMPVMDGPMLIAALRRINPGVRVIAATGLKTSDLVKRAAALGVERFLNKPYSAETLLQAVQQELAAMPRESPPGTSAGEA